MGLRDKMRRLEGAGRGNLEHFELRDGLRYYYDITKVQKEVFIHGIACLRADSLEVWPEVPEVYRKLCEARDPAAVLERLNSAEFVDFPYEETPS
jgi:hypothetical protein